MQIDIDYAGAKTMASRLQQYLENNPKPKLSRSSAIEAIAKVLGFNNRNEMAAKLRVSENPPSAPLSEAVQTELARLTKACAQELIIASRIRSASPDFKTAVHTEDSDGIYALIAVEEGIASRAENDPDFLTCLRTALSTSPELESATEVRTDGRSRLAYALVNEAYPIADKLWSTRAGDSKERATSMNLQKPEGLTEDLSYEDHLRTEMSGLENEPK